VGISVHSWFLQSTMLQCKRRHTWHLCMLHQQTTCSAVPWPSHPRICRFPYKGWLGKWWSKLASFPGCLLLHSLDRICNLWTARRSGRRPGISSTSLNHKVDSIMTCMDSVSVIMATCPHMFLRVLLRSPQTNGSSFLVSYCWLLRYRGGPPEVSGMDPLVVLLL